MLSNISVLNHKTYVLLTICSTTTNIILCCHNTCVFLNSYLADHGDDIPVHGSDSDASKKRALMVLFLPANYERAGRGKTFLIPFRNGIAKALSGSR